MIKFLITTNRRSALVSQVEFLGFKYVSNGPISPKFPNPTPEDPFIHNKSNSDIINIYMRERER